MLDQAITGPANGFLGGPRVGDVPVPPTHGRFTITPLSPTIGGVVEDLAGR
ncbi:MAG: hypothetical protein R2710_25105 [Acidimicrobiales bacterium]